jgi:hypothetical protein
MTSLLEQINGYLFGGQPIKRQDRKAGETQYYYINPGQEYATAGSLKTTDIPDEMMNPDGTMKTTGSFNNMQKYNQEVMNNINQQQVQTNDPNCYIEFNLDYTKHWQKANNRNVVLYAELRNYFLNITAVIALYLGITLKRYTQTERTLIITLIFAVLLNLVGIILPNNPFLHYLYILYPLTFLMSVIAIKHWQKFQITFIILSICFMLSGLYCASNIQKTVSDKNARQAATMINTLLQKDETFQTLGWDMARLHLLSGHAASTPYVLTGMYDRLHQRYLYTFIKNAHPPLVAIVTYPENDFYHKLIKAYWKNFDRDYVLFSNRFGYEIYVLRHKIPKVQPQ